MTLQVFEKNDCRLSHSDKPCKPHKEYSVKCDNCKYYDPFDIRILIIKLAADGDVLRTTCLLPKLKDKYPNAHITWITAQSAKPLLEKNPYVDRIWAPPEQYMPELMAEQFDLVINTDTDAHSCALTSVVSGKEFRGFKLNQNGTVLHLSDAALHWMKMGKWDDLKRKNRNTYPEIIYKVCGFEGPIYGPILNLSKKENRDAKEYLANRGWKNNSPRLVVGMNTGAGSRWKRKSLPINTLHQVISLLKEKEPDIDIFILGGPEEEMKNRQLTADSSDNIIHTGTKNPLRRFAAIINHIDIMFAADTLAMHIGMALKKHVITHFGPTSSWEIDMRGKGQKLVPNLNCICCYLPNCEVKPACNEVISADEIVSAIRKGLEQHPKSN